MTYPVARIGWLVGVAIVFVISMGACRHDETVKTRAASAPSASVPAPAASAVASTRHAGTEVQEPERPWGPFDKSRCALPVARSPSIQGLFAKSRRLRDRAELDSLVGQGIAGAPERFGLRVEGTFRAGCECGPFHAWFSTPEPSFTPIMAIERKGVPGVGFRMNLSFILVGYFSGAYIDKNEQFRVLAVEPGEPEPEQRGEWLERDPEFCVEAICYSVPEWKNDPELGDKEHYAAFLRETSARHAKDMAQVGIQKCKPEWVQPEQERRTSR